MHRLSLALPLILLSTLAQAHPAPDHQHGNLDAHVHGAAELDVALERAELDIELRSPAMNLVGFEHAPGSAADDRKVADARKQLEQPAALFGLPASASCALKTVELESPLFHSNAETAEHAHEHHDHDSQHSDIHARYRYDCSNPEALQGINLQRLFEAFPATEQIQTQLIGPNGQRGAQLTTEHPQLDF
ncbi:DUF2796 domain-containing protein [Pseudomonas stutzeri]|uniref:DUF2796 domain-containing protein n=1 Tax=Stutzerimonas stutzeri TaxID=316 RepID=UPI00210A566D|nr:DUF2796 domain-containing protein [Stutzerimonas stutzeri]MCQ4309725.1 DUF2796 domain-containing protein [Stutzerimonas stutzeri]